MKILFICGNLEKGRDGVGDYTRRLAIELTVRGHNCGLLSLRDRCTQNKPVEEEEQEHIPVFRLSLNLPIKERIQLAARWVEKQNPAIISLQYVPYAFDLKGIPFRFPGDLKKIRKGKPVHIMFHELWLGEAKNSSLREKLIGFLQRTLSLRIIRQSAFGYVFTNASFYKKCLNREHVTVKLTPIFNSLPIGNSSSRLYETLPEAIRENRENYIIGCFFGATHFHPQFSSKVARLKAEISSMNKKLVVLHIGKGTLLPEFTTAFALQEIELIVLGEQEAADVADLFTCVDIGLSTYPKILYQKSSSMASMLNNGLPVVLLRDSFEKDDSQVKEVKEVEEIDSMADFVYQPKSFSYLYSADYTIEQYVKLLNG